VGIFDDSPQILGHKIRGIEVLPTERIDEICLENKVEEAILCIPKEAAASMVERLISLGVRGFWNFSHYDISLHYPGVLVENVHLGDSLMTLSYKLNTERQ
jgi:redox-sensing transcriptional repressor